MNEELFSQNHAKHGFDTIPAGNCDAPSGIPAAGVSGISFCEVEIANVIDFL